jgi:hypothetical protein
MSLSMKTTARDEDDGDDQEAPGQVASEGADRCRRSAPPRPNHGKDTYYGQDFFVGTQKGHDFFVALPYPFGTKGDGFQGSKTEIARYGNIARALRVIREFESELYGDSLVPVALAHRHTSISLKPGGRVFDIMAKRAMPGGS